MISASHWKDGAGSFIPGMLLLIFIIAMIPASAQEVGPVEEGHSSTSSLFIALFANGEALVEYNVGIQNPLAEETMVKLFGEDIRDLVVVDYEDNVVEFSSGEMPNEIILNRPNASNVKISYTTSDFLSKDRREWIFSLNSTVSLSVKLPPDSILTDPGQNPSIVLVGDQQILTYKPGNIRFVYVIGTLGTEEQANIVITAAESTIVQINTNHPGIVLTGAKDMLQSAREARDNRRFTEAERLADQANDAAIATGREYDAAREAIGNAEAQINSAAAAGGGRLDNAVTRQMLEQANNEFAIGNYTEARSSAQDAVTTLGEKPAQAQTLMPVMITAITIAAVAAAGGIGAIIFLRKRRRLKPVPEFHKANDLPKHNSNNNIGSRAAAIFRPTNSVGPVEPKRDIDELEEQQEVAESVEETSSVPPMPTTISDSPIDSTILSHIVGNILLERPHLRPEDQQVLKFLAEKEGAAFESEIRSKFQIPKTTIWRLVKRLEREELVEIRKAGGQNLIKLRFEDKQA
ncbi:MAG TPA: hypothetical protein VN239_03695 [Nitrososphaera sp.]|jgi:hypothetical protein|nr:hypothetical protein [Nitrososphaera sp.]